jgi:thioesterase domain-containing protein
MARQLRSQGEQIGLLLLLDSAPANAGYEKLTWWRPSYGFRFAKNLGYWLHDFGQLSARERHRYVTRKLGALCRKSLRRLRGNGGHRAVDLEEVIDPAHFPENELKLWQAHLEAMSAHTDQPFDGKVILLRTRGQPLLSSLEEDFCWGRLAKGGVKIRFVPGSHENVFMEPNVRALAAELQAALTEVQHNQKTI